MSDTPTKPTTDLTAEEAAFQCGLSAEIPPPQIVMNPVLYAEWERGMDEREKQGPVI